MRKTPLLVFAFSCAIISKVWAQNALNNVDQRLAGLDSVAQRVLQDWNAAGCAIAVVEKGQVLFVGGFGYRDYAARLKVTENTLFQIGSCTKAFTCALMGSLANEGMLSLDGKVIDYLPAFRMQREDVGRCVTLRDFMCHRSGLLRHDLSWLQSPTTRDSFVLRMAHLEMSADLRERWQYNNFGYTLLGRVAERVAQKSWEELVNERLLKPLGMDRARFDLWTLPASADVARGYRAFADSIRPIDYFRIEGMGPAGSLCASAVDLSRWLLLWLKGGVFEGRALLSPNYVQEALSARWQYPARCRRRKSPAFLPLDTA